MLAPETLKSAFGTFKLAYETLKLALWTLKLAHGTLNLALSTRGGILNPHRLDFSCIVGYYIISWCDVSYVNQSQFGHREVGAATPPPLKSEKMG